MSILKPKLLYLKKNNFPGKKTIFTYSFNQFRTLVYEKIVTMTNLHLASNKRTYRSLVLEELEWIFPRRFPCTTASKRVTNFPFVWGSCTKLLKQSVFAGKITKNAILPLNSYINYWDKLWTLKRWRQPEILPCKSKSERPVPSGTAAAHDVTAAILEFP